MRYQRDRAWRDRTRAGGGSPTARVALVLVRPVARGRGRPIRVLVRQVHLQWRRLASGWVRSKYARRNEWVGRKRDAEDRRVENGGLVAEAARAAK